MTDTHFLEGKLYREDEIGEATVRAANWRYMAFGSLGLSVLLALGLTVVALRPQLQPYYIEVERSSGETRVLGFAPTHWTPPDAAEAKQVREFITAMLTVSPTDKEQMRRRFRALYPQATKNGKRLLNHVEAHRKPFDQRDPVTIDITRTLKKGPHEYVISWRETRYSAQLDIQHYSGLFVATTAPPQTQEEIEHNPLGIFLDTWSISKE